MRKMTKEEFVTRMQADAVNRKEREAKARYDLNDYTADIIYKMYKRLRLWRGKK